MLDEKDLLLIEEYLDGNLEAKALEKFEARLKTEPLLAKQLDISKEVNQQLRAIHKNLKKEEWKSILKKEDKTQTPDKTQKVVGIRRILYVAASAAVIALLFTVAMNYFSSPTLSSPELAMQYWEKSDSFFSTYLERGDAGPLVSKHLSDAFNAYDKGNYRGAIASINKLQVISQDVQLLRAACFFKTDENNLAINLLLPLINDPKSIVRDEAEWYLALVYLKTDQTEKAKNILNNIISKKSWNHKKAKEILKEI